MSTRAKGFVAKLPQGVTDTPELPHPHRNLGSFLQPSRKTKEINDMKIKSTNPLPAPPAGVKLPGVKATGPKPRVSKPPVNVAPLSQLIPGFGQPVGVTMPKMGTGNKRSIPAAKGPSGMRGSKY